MTAPRTLAALLGGRVLVRIGDITQEDAGAVVNAANSTLLGGGGVDGAIHRAAGTSLLDACREVRKTLFPGGLPTGEAVATPGGMLRAALVIHTVGPVWGSHAGRESELLASCYERSLDIAATKSLSTIAFPAISTGVFGFPREKAAAVASKAIAAHLSTHHLPREVRLVFFSAEDADVFLANQSFGNGGGA